MFIIFIVVTQNVGVPLSVTKSTNTIHQEQSLRPPIKPPVSLLIQRPKVRVSMNQCIVSYIHHNSVQYSNNFDRFFRRFNNNKNDFDHKSQASVCHKQRVRSKGRVPSCYCDSSSTYWNVMDFKNDQEMILSLALRFMNIYTLFYRFGVHISIFLSFLSKDENSLILIVFMRSLHLIRKIE